MRARESVFAFLTLLLVFCLTLSGTFAFGAEVPPDPLIVVAGKPAAADGKASIYSAVKGVFSRPVYPDSVSETTFAVTDQSAAPVSGNFSFYGNTVAFVPAAPLTPDAQYNVSISGVTTDMGGTTLQTPYSWSFNTASLTPSANFMSDFQADGIFAPYRDSDGTDYYPVYENIMDSGGWLYGTKYWYYDSGWSDDGYSGSHYVLDNSGNWQWISDDPSDLQVLDYNADGSVILQSSTDSHSEVLIPEEFDITGEPVNTYLPQSGLFAIPGTTFPEGSKAYRITFARTSDSFEVDTNDLTWFDGSSSQAVSSLSEIQTYFATGEINYLRRDKYAFQLGSDNSVSFFEDGPTGVVSLPLKGSWEIKTIYGTDLLVVYTPAEYKATLNEKGDTIFASPWDGFVYQGLWHHAGEIRTEPGFTYNLTAFNAFLDNFAPISFSAYVTGYGSEAQPLYKARVEMVGNPLVYTFTDTDAGWFTIPGLPSQIPFALKMEMSGFVPTYSANFTAAADIDVQQELPFNMLTPEEYGSFSNSPGTGVILGRAIDMDNPWNNTFSGVSFSATGQPSGNSYFVETSGDGMFQIRNVPDNETVSVSAFLSGWNFTPTGFTVHQGAVSMGGILGTSNALLKVTKTQESNGTGAVSSDPYGIDMPSYATEGNAVFPIDTQVTLTATPDPGSVFTGWGGADAGTCAGKTTPCRILMNAAKSLTAAFALLPVQLVNPNGGEELYANQTYTVNWTAAPNAVNFHLRYNDGSGWKLIKAFVTGTSYVWTVPTVTTRTTGFNFMVTAMDAAGVQIGFDTSDAPFAINPTAISITSPANGTIYSTLGTIDLTISAGPMITSVEFYNGATLLGTASSAPFDFAWTNVPNGTHSITAKGYDASGNTYNSSPVTVKVITVHLVNPNGSEELYANQTYTVNWTADPNAAKFQLRYNDGSGWKLIKANLTGTSYVWTVPAVATRTTGVNLMVTAMDAAGVQIGFDTSDAPFAINPTAISITSPANGTSYSTLGTVNLTTNTGPMITSVEYYNGATLLGTASSAPFDFAWTNVPNGSYSITAKGYDALGQTYTSAPVTVKVVTVRVVNPNGGEELVSNQTYTVNWVAGANAAKFHLRYNDGSGWKLIKANVTGTSYSWTVPAVGVRTTGVNFMVTAMDAAGVQIGFDTSDTSFAINP